MSKIQNYISEDMVEEVHAGLTTVPGATTEPLKVVAGAIGNGYDAVIVSVAVSQNNSIWAWVKKGDKQVYENGLASAALPASLGECPINKGILENQKWEFGLTNVSAGDLVVAWLIRIRLIKKGFRSRHPIDTHLRR